MRLRAIITQTGACHLHLKLAFGPNRLKADCGLLLNMTIMNHSKHAIHHLKSKKDTLIGGVIRATN